MFSLGLFTLQNDCQYLYLTMLAEGEEELKSLLMKVKEESGKVG